MAAKSPVRALSKMFCLKEALSSALWQAISCASAVRSSILVEILRRRIRSLMSFESRYLGNLGRKEQVEPDRSHEPECRHAQRRCRQKKVKGKAYSYDRTKNHVSVLHRMCSLIPDQRSLLKQSQSIREAFAGVRVCRARVAPVSNPSSPHTRRAPPPCGVPP